MIYKNFPNKKYRIIYVDPPWDYGKMKPRKLKCRGGNPQSHYKTMTIDEICNLPIASCCESNSALFLWVTNPKIKLGFQVLDSWGFKYQTILTWVKIDKSGCIINNGLGFYFRGATEHLLFGTKGKFRILSNKRESNCFAKLRCGHSRKPISVYSLIERISKPPYLELFARKKRISWDSWGNEV